MKAISSLAAFVIIAGVLLWAFWPKGAESQIHKQLDSIEGLVTTDSPLTPINVAARAKQLAEFYTEDCEVYAHERAGTVIGNRQLTQVFAGLLGMSHQVQLELTHRDIQLSESERDALVLVTAKLDGTTKSGDRESFEGRYRMEWLFDQNRWRIRRLTWLD